MNQQRTSSLFSLSTLTITVLAASLALNLAVVGLVAGLMLRGPGPLRGGGPGLSYALPYIVALDRSAAPPACPPPPPQ